MAAQGNKKDANGGRDQIAKVRAHERRAKKNRKILLATGAGLAVTALAVGIGWVAQDKTQSPTPAAAAATKMLLAPVWSGLTGQTVDGVTADTVEHLAYHIHSHLAIYVDGEKMTVPGGVGIGTPWETQAEPDGSVWIAGGSSFYYLHTHTTDGIIHVESPTAATYVLGQFFAEWNQPLAADRVGPDQGTVTTYVNGAVYTGDPAQIPLDPHTVIQLDVGKDVPPVPYTFAPGL